MHPSGRPGYRPRTRKRVQNGHRDSGEHADSGSHHDQGGFPRRGTPIGFRRWAHYTGLEHAPPICRAGQPLHRLRPARRSMARGSPRSCETARFHARNSKKAIASRKANALMGLISAEGLPRASGSVGHLGIVPMCAVPRSRSDGASSSSARISTKAATPALGSWHHEWPGSSCQ